VRVLVTGGAGFVGSHVARRLVDTGNTVFVLDDLSTGKRSNLRNLEDHGNFRLIRGDIRHLSRSVIRKLKRVDRVVHLAALTSVQGSIRDPAHTTEVNVLGTLKVLEAAKALKAERVVFASSAAVYGNPQVFPIKEDARIQPMSPYGASKAASEHYLESFERNHGIEAFSLRYFNIYGQRQTRSHYAGVISVFLRRALNEEVLAIYGDGSQTRDFIFISDAVDAAVAALERPLESRVFNVASGTETTILELAKKILEITQTKSALKFCPPQVGDIRRSLADTNRAQRELGFKAKASIQIGLASTIRWLTEDQN